MIRRSQAKIQDLRVKGAALAVTDVLGVAPKTDGEHTAVASTTPTVVLTPLLFAQSYTAIGRWCNWLRALLEHGQRSKLPAAS